MYNSLGTHVGILATQDISLDKQFKSTDDVDRLLKRKGEGRLQSGTKHIHHPDGTEPHGFQNLTRISRAMSRYGSYVSDTLLQIEHFTAKTEKTT